MSDYIKNLLGEARSFMRRLEGQEADLEHPTLVEGRRLSEAPNPIDAEYKQLMKLDIKQLRDMYSRSHRVSDTRGVPKSALVADILRAKYGHKKVDAAFGLKEAIDPAVQSHVQALLKKYQGKEVPDDLIHKIADENGVSPHDVESYIYSLASAHLNEAVPGAKKFTVVYELSYRDKTSEHIATFHTEEDAREFADDQNSQGNKATVYRGLGKHKTPLKEADTKGWDPELLKLARQYDRDQVNMGIKVEKEHDQDPATDVVKDKNDLLKIALAHLAEDPEYYTKLADMEGDAVSEDRRLNYGEKAMQFKDLEVGASFFPLETHGGRPDQKSIVIGDEPSKKTGPRSYTSGSDGRKYSGNPNSWVLPAEVGEGYMPSEYPQQRDPYRQGGFSPYTHISQNGSIPRMARSKQKSVKRKPLSPGARSHLKEASFIKGKGATGKIELKRDQAPVGHGYSIDVNGAWGAFWPDAPRDAVVVEMVNIDDGSPYGKPFTDYDIEPKAAYEYVMARIKRAGIRKFINAVRKAAGTQPNSPLRQSGSIRLRGLVKPSLKGPVRFVEYDFNRFDFKL